MARKTTEKKVDAVETKTDEQTVEPKTVAQPVVAKAVSIDVPGVKCDRVEPGTDAANQLAYYAAEDKVRTRIPRGAGEKPGAFETVIVNGLRINILKGENVSLPVSVAQIIEDAFYQTEKALNPKIANPFTGKKSEGRVDMQGSDDKAALDA